MYPAPPVQPLPRVDLFTIIQTVLISLEYSKDVRLSYLEYFLVVLVIHFTQQ